jgi:hypothetical protein
MNVTGATSSCIGSSQPEPEAVETAWIGYRETQPAHAPTPETSAQHPSSRTIPHCAATKASTALGALQRWAPVAPERDSGRNAPYP